MRAMPPAKVKIERIEDDKARQTTFHKRKTGLIKKAIELRFGVKVSKVAVINNKGKKKSMSVKSSGRTIRTEGRRASTKKAIVTLKEGSQIDLTNMEF